MYLHLLKFKIKIKLAIYRKLKIDAKLRDCGGTYTQGNHQRILQFEQLPFIEIRD
jgi:hypothetical protein